MDWNQEALDGMRDRRRRHLLYTTGRDDKALSLRMPVELVEKLTDYAAWLGASRNAVIVMMIQMCLADEEAVAEETLQLLEGGQDE